MELVCGTLVLLEVAVVVSVELELVLDPCVESLTAVVLLVVVIVVDVVVVLAVVLVLTVVPVEQMVTMR